MRRRGFLAAAAGLGAGAAVLAALGGLPGRLLEQPTRVRRVGYLFASDRASSLASSGAFVDKLHELGWVEGQNLVIEWREALGQEEAYPRLAAELAALDLDVLVGLNTRGITALKDATDTIPIVAGTEVDPVALGLGVGRMRPGANVTGLTGVSLSAKRVELFKECVPHLSRVGILRPEPGDAANMQTLADVEAAARSLGLEPVDLPVPLARPDVEPVLEAALGLGVTGIIQQPTVVLNSQAGRVAELVFRARLPGMFTLRQYVAARGLMSYGADPLGLSRKTATFVDRILRGANPATLPFEGTDAFGLHVNTTTASALGLSVPASIAAQVTEWIA